MALRCLIVVLLFKFGDAFLFFSSGNRLESYNIDRSQISVSGVSSGAAMASQLHVIFSREFMGAGLIAGVPFACSGGLVATAVGACMKVPSSVSATALEALTTSGAHVGNVDPVSHLADDRVFIFNGHADSVVNPGIGRVIEDYYSHYLSDPSQIQTVFNIEAEHSQPTDNYGGACDVLSTGNYINNCNYSAAFHLLDFIYGGSLKMPTQTTVLNGKLLTFSQDDFFYLSTPATYSMDNQGYVYVPSGCLSKTKRCKLHVALHGCSMGRTKIGDVYVRHGGYNEVGELNDIIILYPQAIATATNLQGCWDWFGYTGPLFATKNGFQPTALKRMLDRIVG